MMSQTANMFEIKSANLDLLSIALLNDDLEGINKALENRFGNASSPSHEAFILDLDASCPLPATIYKELFKLLLRYGIKIVALRHQDSRTAVLASKLGVAYVNGNATPARQNKPASSQTILSKNKPATIISRPVRAGQRIYAEDCDLIVLSIVSAGAEIIADGNIHVYAPLRGRAAAGASGNTSARIFAQSMDAEIISIAGIFRTLEQDLPADLQGRPAQVYLDDNDRLVIEALSK